MPIIPFCPAQLRFIYQVYLYLKYLVLDTIDYYLGYLVLSLPAYLFSAPVIKICQQLPESSDSDSDDQNLNQKEFYVFISQLIFIHKEHKIPPTMVHRIMSGLQLKPLINENGRFFIGHIQRYYPTLDTIVLKYIKIPVEDCAVKSPRSDADDLEVITKVIDVNKRYDIRNNKSCKLGVAF